jgi:hypothetical protein
LVVACPYTHPWVLSCWGSVQIAKIYWLRNPKLTKDLSTSNARTVEVQGHTLVDRTRGLRSRTSVDDKDDVADLKVDGDLGGTTPVSPSGTSAYSHTYGDHDDSRNPRSSQDCGSRWLRTGIQKLCSTMVCSVGDSLLLCSPSGGHAGVREVESGGQGMAGGQEVEGAAREERLVEIGVFSPPKALPYIGGRGCTLPPPQGSPRAVAKGGARVEAARAGRAQPPPNPNPGRPGPGA